MSWQMIGGFSVLFYPYVFAWTFYYYVLTAKRMWGGEFSVKDVFGLGNHTLLIFLGLMCWEFLMNYLYYHFNFTSIIKITDLPSI